jgi:hypothetical protein
MPLQFTAAPVDAAALLDLPWDVPLEQWPPDQLVPLPRGISRHVVRFVRLGNRVYAVKEVGQFLAEREYRLLRDLERLDAPAVEAIGIVSGREDAAGAPLDPALVTRHLQFSLPYRALFSRTLRADTANRLLDALSVLLVRLHLLGFFWGDCSLSNTLFRRDAGAFAAYLVDAETGELHPGLSDGQRAHDLDTARVNITGELMDLQAGRLLPESVDPFDTAEKVCAGYSGLWNELTGQTVVRLDERYLIDARVRRLNELGYDVAEMTIEAEPTCRRVRMRPKVVDAGHHSRRLLRLTGLDAEENQARRLLNDLDTFRAATGRFDEDEQIGAHQWLTHVFEPVVAAVPRELRGKLEPAEIFHEVLEHRWFLSETAGKDIGLDAAIRDYVETVLQHKPDEKAVLGTRVGGTLDEPDPLQDTAELRITLPDV